MSYKLVEALQKEAVTVTQSCQALGISRAGYYAALRRAKLTPCICATSVRLQAAFAASGKSYGSRRLHTALLGDGIEVARFV